MEEAFDCSSTLQRTAHVLNVHDISSFDPRHTGKNFRTAAIPSCGVTDGVTYGVTDITTLDSTDTVFAPTVPINAIDAIDAFDPSAPTTSTLLDPHSWTHHPVFVLTPHCRHRRPRRTTP